MTTEDSWHTEWYWPDDTILARYTGVISPQILNEALDSIFKMQEAAGGDLKIYSIVDESQVTDIAPNIIGQTVVHPVFFHPRSGKIYFVGCSRELRLANEGLNFRRPDMARFVDTIEEAAQAIQQSRAAYRARQEAAKEQPNDH
jgi:hypothetical protein